MNISVFPSPQGLRILAPSIHKASALPNSGKGSWKTYLTYLVCAYIFNHWSQGRTKGDRFCKGISLIFSCARIHSVMSLWVQVTTQAPLSSMANSPLRPIMSFSILGCLSLPFQCSREVFLMVKSRIFDLFTFSQFLSGRINFSTISLRPIPIPSGIGIVLQ